MNYVVIVLLCTSLGCFEPNTTERACCHGDSEHSSLAPDCLGGAYSQTTTSLPRFCHGYFYCGKNMSEPFWALFPEHQEHHQTLLFHLRKHSLAKVNSRCGWPCKSQGRQSNTVWSMCVFPKCHGECVCPVLLVVFWVSKKTSGFMSSSTGGRGRPKCQLAVAAQVRASLPPCSWRRHRCLWLLRWPVGAFVARWATCVRGEELDVVFLCFHHFLQLF